MADKRKLHGEIDRCLKKVAEGVETFEDIWKKVHSASNANQKEKYEADLKKEIKKLQRLRDQIKTWLTSNDIKDKRPLMDNRKLIETQMERFKIVERETKTKAYSKEGLGLAAKIDPAQREKDEVRHWLTECIDKLNLQIDQFEAEVESLYASSRKRKLDRDKQDRVDELNEWTERHRFHIQKLETIMRMMDNCSVETDSVKLLQDDLNYYVESNQEPDFAENEMMYDDLEIEETSIYSTSTVIATPTAPHQAINEEEVNSIASSPSSSQGPLSPKTPTTMKSTSQELFDERRRGKTSVSSSSDNPNDNKPPPPPSAPSPRKPVNKLPLLQNSTVPLRSMSHSGNKVTTPTTTTPSKSNSLGRSVSSGAPPSNGSASPRGASKPAQLPQGPAYAIAAGGQQNSGAASSNSSSSPTSTTHQPHKETTSLSSQQPQPPQQDGPSLHSSTGGSSSGGSTTVASGVPSSAVPTSVDHSQQVVPTQSVPPAPGVAGTTTSSGSVPMEVPANAPSSMAPPVTSTAPTQHQPTPATQQPRPHAINTKPEHSRTSSTSSSFSPSTLSQDSQPTLSQSGTGAAGVEVSLVNSVGGAQPCTSASPISEATPLVIETSHRPQQQLSSPADSQPSSALSPNNTPSSEMSPAASTTSSVGGGVARTVSTATPVTTLSSSGYQPAPPPSTTSLAPLSLAQPLSGASEGVVGGSGLRLPVTLTTVSETQSTGMTALIQQAYQSSSSGGMEYPSWMSVTSGGMATSSANAISSFMANTGASSVGSPPLPISSPSPLIMAVSQQQQSHTASHSPFTSSSTPLMQVPPSSPFTTAAVSGLLTVQPTTSGSMFPPSESSPAVSMDSMSQENPPSSLKAMAAQVVAASSSYGLSTSTGGFPHDSKAETADQTLRPMLDPSVAAPGTRISEGVTPAWTDTQLQPLLGVTPLGPVQLSQEKTYQLRMLEGACKHLPQPSDSERVRPYLMRNPFPTPYYYHQHPPTHFDSFEFFQRLSIETLFFIFYYMEGTKAQFMAAKALKKLSWRFHTKYMMWFQRLEEPKAITDDYEMGTYIYFDFEKWSQRKKEGFTFEYRYLEDRDLQ